MEKAQKLIKDLEKNKDKFMAKLYEERLEQIKKYCEDGINFYKLMDKGKLPRQYDDDFVQERVRIEQEYIFNDILKMIRGE